MNLSDLQKIVEDCSRSGMPPSFDSVFLHTFRGIIGNYQETLQDCDRLLRDNTKFSRRGDFIHNILWNFTVASEVQTLKDKLAFLNIKILTILKTLDLKMADRLNISIYRIHRDLASRIDEARVDIIEQFQVLRSEILGFLTGSPNAVASGSRAQVGPFNISASLEGLFEERIRMLNVESDQFPLVRGLDAVVYHINAANTIATDNKGSKRERRWLEIAKAYCIITRVRAGQEYVFPAFHGFRKLCVIIPTWAKPIKTNRVAHSSTRTPSPPS